MSERLRRRQRASHGLHETAATGLVIRQGVSSCEKIESAGNRSVETPRRGVSTESIPGDTLVQKNYHKASGSE